jgi:hypothetical protein
MHSAHILPINFIISVIVICYLVSGCDKGVTFSEPQPVNGELIKGFPKKIQGQYVSKLFATHLSIQEKSIIKTIEWSGITAKRDLDSNYHLQDTLIVSNDGNDHYPVQVIGDSFKVNIHWQDTLFLFSDKNIAKKFKGYIFLNETNDNINWAVTKLSLEKGMLYVGKISSGDDIDKLRQITETSDTTSYSFKPTQKQFGLFVKQKGFKDVEEFVRIRN